MRKISKDELKDDGFAKLLFSDNDGRRKRLWYWCYWTGITKFVFIRDNQKFTFNSLDEAIDEWNKD